jgi:predicted dithiol-disulfide oxidoreductase (DUF899 family)
MQPHKIVSREEWTEARQALMVREKELTQARDRLSEARRALPWVRVDKAYVFEGVDGRQGLADLFRGRPQLVVQHFMFAPEWDEGCKSCSFWADGFERMIPHLAARDTTLVAVSRAPLEKLVAFRKRMGWSFDWVSSAGSDFNYAYQASFTPEDIQSGAVFYNYSTTKMTMTDREGVSVFYKDDSGVVFHTYSCYARGIDMMNTAYQYLDLVPKGRDEDRLPSSQAWVQYHDRYKD